MLTAFIPTVYANSSVTAEDVKKATAKTSIVNNIEDYEIFKSEIKDENILQATMTVVKKAASAQQKQPIQKKIKFQM